MPHVLEPISCRDWAKEHGDRFTKEFRVGCTFEELEKFGINKLPEAIGTIKLPGRQINGSSYREER